MESDGVMDGRDRSIHLANSFWDMFAAKLRVWK